MNMAAQTLEAQASIADRVQVLRDTFANGRTRDLAWRKGQLTRLEALINEQQEAIAEALYADLGKCKTEAWTSEIGFTLSDIQHTRKHLGKWSKPRKVSTPIAAQPGKSYQLPEPLGTVLVIGAWNYPFQLVLAPVIAAIAAGNCVVMKPSELASNTSSLLARLIPQYLDQEAFLVIEGAVEETTQLLALPFDHILYTGGEQVGKIVMRAAAEHLTPVTLELGGKSPCLVDDDANLDVTAARIVWSKWMNAGQTCVAPDYVLVTPAQKQPLMEALTKALETFYGKDPATSKDYGRIINDRHFARLQGYLDNQTIALGGQCDEGSRYMAPTILDNPAADSPVMQEEIFGPILPIIEIANLDEAIAWVNQRPKPLALYVYSNSDACVRRVLNETSAGNVCINDGFMFMVNSELPFGGVGNSGMGAYHGQSGFDTFSHLKTVMHRSFRFDVPLRYPPFSALKLSLLKRLL
ncbi:aldehyde dehydrogenase family protein [Aestuariibacter halophilus]|uniref:Aldehyde dehydrogenase n=1 Tax=Fluctibacter halophilus TaxID=226011 RepID=A0ABS8G9M6_9ALTE|nr:aldehyde dehydrogenase family protein [Aestuariibacter halophilus]MCC2617213.1 aldehyde dehydrogenase family protein [Aestuariibacter halophilus]